MSGCARWGLFIALLWHLGSSARVLAQEATALTLIIQAAHPMERMVSDLHVAIRDPNQVHDAAPVLSVAAGSVALFRFDLSRLPRSAQVLSASLELWAEGRSAPAPLDVAVYPFERPWGEGAAWVTAVVEQLKGRQGATEGGDRDGMLSRQTLDGVGRWFGWEVTDAVRRQWQAASDEVTLLMEAEGEGVEYYLASSEWRNADQRPRLAVQYWLPRRSPVTASFPARTAQEDMLSWRSIYGKERFLATLYGREVAVPGPLSASLMTLQPAVAETPEPAPLSLPSPVPEAMTATMDPALTPASPTLRAEAAFSEPIALTPTPATIPAAIATPSPSSWIQAKIEALWPSGPGQVSATAHLFSDASLTPPPCAWEPTVRLWGAGGSAPARPLAVGKKRMAEERGVRFPAWDFTGVDVSALGQLGEPMHFFAMVDGVPTAHNVVSLGQDVRTLNAAEPVPTGLVQEMPSRVDAWIGILWPHGGVPVQQAERANLTAILFAAGTRLALPTAGFKPTVRLHWAINDAVDVTGGQGLPGLPREVSREGVRYTVWDFNDVDVRPARSPDNRMYFWLSVDGLEASSTVWVHSVDGRPILPTAELPASSCQ